MKKDVDTSLIKNLSVSDVKIDMTNVNNLNGKVLGEQESRNKWLSHARAYGCEKEMLLLFAKYDKLLRNCSNEKERKDIGKLGAIEAYNLFDSYGKLYVDGQLVIDR